MPQSTRHIGLSLGADVCWPICFEEIIKRLDLKLELPDETVTFDVERVTIEPFDLRQDCKYDVVVDRLTHWYHTSREWIKKSIILNDLYVFNNPWSLQSMEKQTTYSAMIKLGFPIPQTWLVPPKEYEKVADLEPTLARYARMFDLGDVGKGLGYPMFMKPYDGGGWVGVSRIDNEEALKAAYEQSGKHVMHLQHSVEDFDAFVRCVGVGPQLRLVSYDPAAPLHDRYRMEEDFVDAKDEQILRDMTYTINAFFGWDFNSCEALRNKDGWFPIDFANPCPDSQVTSLHWHFPWLVGAIVKWAIFCAATKRSMRMNLDWEPFFKINEEGGTFEEKLPRYAALARKRLDVDAFDEFCVKHLSNFDEVIWEFFDSDRAREAIQAKVETLYPEHEIEEFTNLFWDRIQNWREGHRP
ncbi:MAG: hypothetical protein HKN21_06775 [Candidatus Eisenbacteria bacterium]|uniref:ATP-grasp domain-containing protein n=1 Tax=Eiseniibacteriota bacterium TaxID=2212470 RepID=A0A7Y2E8L8_UNCEI|nr:hypothetical protein [Candidatus Eisenbacteria bacterium]